MTLHTYALSPSRPGDFKILNAIARIHLAAWLTLPLMRTIMYGPESTYPARIARYLKKHTNSLKNEELVRYIVAVDDELAPDEDEGSEEGLEEGDRPKGRVIAAIKYYLVPPTGPYPDADTQAGIDEHLLKSNKETRDTVIDSSLQGVAADGPPSNNALSDIFVSELVAARQEARRTLGTHVLVDNLYTDPAHHRRGAGGILMRLAVQYADELGLPSMLEASPSGMKVYERVGFEVQQGKDIWVDLKRWENGGDKGAEFSERRLEESGGVRRAEDGWYAQVIMVRPARSTKESVPVSAEGGKGDATVT